MLVIAHREVDAATTQLQALQPTSSALTARCAHAQHVQRLIEREVLGVVFKQRLTTLKRRNALNLRRGT